MRKIVVLLSTALLLVNVLTFAQNKDNSSIQEIEFKVPIPKSNEGILRAPARKVVSAFIQSDLLKIYFTSSAPNATISISNKLTGEVEYTEVCNTQSTVINLSMLAFEGDGTYTIEVSTENWKRFGVFTY